MKRIVIILAAGLALTGCATDMSKYYEVQGKAIEADPWSIAARRAAAQFALDEGDVEEAERHCAKVYLLRPKANCP